VDELGAAAASTQDEEEKDPAVAKTDAVIQKRAVMIQIEGTEVAFLSSKGVDVVYHRKYWLW